MEFLLLALLGALTGMLQARKRSGTPLLWAFVGAILAPAAWFFLNAEPIKELMRQGLWFLFALVWALVDGYFSKGKSQR